MVGIRMAAQDKVLILVAALLAAVAVAVSVQPGVKPDPRLGVRLGLPERLGAFRGSVRLYCQNPTCDGRFRSVEDRPVRTCPRCGAALDPVSLAERNVLPADTIIVKRVYADGAGRTFAVSIVTSGSEQKSIHRPEQCLPAQGYTIDNRRTWTVPETGGRSFKVTLLDLRAAASEHAERASSFAYWFVGPDRETPHHWERLLWMSYDRAWRGISTRWAYVAVFANSPAGSEAERESFKRFLADLRGNLRPAPSVGRL